MTAAQNLTRTECLDLLRSSRVGRIAVTSQVLPAIVPISYTVVGDRLIFRAQADGMLAKACKNAVVAFETDDVDPDGQAGWSVLVVGTAELLLCDGPEGQSGRDGSGADAPGQYVAITMTKVTGRLLPRSATALGA